MFFSKSFLSLLIHLFFLHLLTDFRAQSRGKYLYHECSNATTFVKNSEYASNLDALLASLSARNSTYAARFGNATAGQGSDKVYGMFLCRVDLSVQVCLDCVMFAANDSRKLCPNQKQNVVWYDECMLRYSYHNIFARKETAPSAYISDDGNIPGNQLQSLKEFMVSKMIEASDAAAASSWKFAVYKTNFTTSQTSYNLVQCTRDLNSIDCKACLQQALYQLPDCCGRKTGRRILQASCHVRFSLKPFYNESGVEAVSAPNLRSPNDNHAMDPQGKGKSSRAKVVAIAIPVSSFVLLLICGSYLLSRRLKTKYSTLSRGNSFIGADPQHFDYKTIASATDNFSDRNKVGAGGFGEVFKGELPNNQEIAVKRLSKGSGQGFEEFKNEVILMTKLQHRNLARILGFCIERGEKMLVYEFVPNKSLDLFLFDPDKQKLLDWPTRYKIIMGIAHGIQYLHQDSRLKIIHRDLKTSNILLDLLMNPKISDFGMARIFDAEQTQKTTKRIVGTYGYMAPEYAVRGRFSIYSDIYSLGVIILEIISGKRRNAFYETNGEDLVNHASKLLMEEPLKLLDPSIAGSCERNEVMQSIHTGLLCVQHNPGKRPTIANVVAMLESSSVTQSVPRQPDLFAGLHTNLSTSMSSSLSANDISLTELHPR